MRKALVAVVVLLAALVAWRFLRTEEATPPSPPPTLPPAPIATPPVPAPRAKAETPPPEEAPPATPATTPKPAPPPRPATVVGRLVDRAGRPIAGMELFGRVVAGEIVGFEAAAGPTDASGRFAFATTRASAAPATARFELGRGRREVGGGLGRCSVALVPLPPSVDDGPRDLGDVAFAGGELLASGVLLDEEGAPASDIVLSADEPGRGGFSPTYQDVDHVVTSSDGTFEFRADPATHPRATFASHASGGYLLDPPVVAAGATNVRLVIARAGSLAGTVRRAEAWDPFDVEVLVLTRAHEKAGGRRPWDDAHHVVVWDDGRFALDGLAPGPVRVRICLGGTNEEDVVLAVDGVQIVAGQVARDPRLQDVDLSKGPPAVRVRVTDAAGAAVAGAKIVARRFDRKGRDWSGATDDSGECRLRVGADSVKAALEFLVVAHGFRSAMAQCSNGEATVALTPAEPCRVRVRLASDAPKLDPGFSYLVFLEWEGSPDEPRAGDADPRDTNPSLDEEGVATFVVSDPGRRRAFLALRDARGGEGLSAIPKYAFVEAVAGETTEVFVTADPEDVRRTMESRRKR